jgi:type III restriction enzyme
MSGFNFEKNLEHQTRAVESTVSVFDGLEIKKTNEIENKFMNPIINHNSFKFKKNIQKIQEENEIKEKPKKDSNIIDIMMETGTGKTYTYTKTIFELNRKFGIFKFVVIVPSLSIKAGTIDFLKSESARNHFKEQYNKTIELHIVESQKNLRNKKSSFPIAVSNFVKSAIYQKNQIQVMIINSSMVNSETMEKDYDISLYDKYSVPFDAIAATKPFLIIDEPHRFKHENKTWKNIEKMKPQFTIRYGATFPEKVIKKKNSLTGKKEKITKKDYHNLVYKLTSVEAFNKNLVKGVIGHITEFEEGKNVTVRFVNSDGKEATFELKDNLSTKKFKLIKKESMEKIHPAMEGLYITKLNKSSVKLSNGMELTKKDVLNPYSYAEKLQEIMIKKAIKNHFELEKILLKREVKIKPLTLFFIDNIDEYRNSDGYIRNTVELYVEHEIKQLLKTEEDEFFRNYLKESLKDISKTHGGYFSKDNSDSDEAVEQEVIEILHDKQSILDLNNPRRFIFSKWTLREGWDNPNVFQICKLRSSGSEISKLQEVGRGLRLPVNEFGNRVKNEQFYLNYFVDFWESDFIEKLADEINEKSGAISIDKIPEKLEKKTIEKICDVYKINEDELLEKLDKENIITRSNTFKNNGYEYIKKTYPLVFDGVSKDKVRNVKEQKRKVKIRKENFSKLKELWEKLNQKVIFQYKIENENIFKDIFIDFLQKYVYDLKPQEILNKTKTIKSENNQANIYEEIIINKDEIEEMTTMTYSTFLKELAKSLNINLKTIHESFKASEVNVNRYLNAFTIRILKQKFEEYLLYNAIDKFGIEYKKITSSIHPTSLTNERGQEKEEIDASEVGIHFSEEQVSPKYLFDELYYDSDLEMKNIKNTIDDVIVFTKIPKNSIRIPVAGGKSYSPDFAYVINFKDGEKKLFFIVETKNANENALRKVEEQKIKHAQKFFGDTINIQFKTQFESTEIREIIENIIDNN